MNDLSPYLDVLDLGTTTGLVLLIEYLEVFSSMRFLMKEGDILFTILNTSHAMRFSRLTWRYCVPAVFSRSLWVEE